MLDRTAAPAFNRNYSFDLITPDYQTTGNGIPVYFVNGGDQNVLKVELIFPAGRWYEAAWGASYFTSNLLSKGTPGKSSFAIASQFDQLGAHVEVVSSADFVTLSLYSLTRNLQPALELLAEIIQTPAFPEKEFDRIKSIYLQNLKVNQEKTSFLASKLFRKTLYGENHPYGKELEPGDVEKLTREDLVAFHHNFFSNFRVIVSGNISDISRKLILDLFASFKTATPQERIHPFTDYKPQRTEITKEGSVQSSLRIGKSTIQRSHADYARLLFLTHILGGYFGSRLMKNIREEKGLTYGIHASLHTMKHNSYLLIGTDVNKENRDLAFDEVKHELRKLREEKVDQQELDTARYHFIGSLQSELSTSFAHAEKIRTILLFNLKNDFYSQLINIITNITAAELQTVANRYYEEDSFFEIAAG